MGQRKSSSRSVRFIIGLSVFLPALAQEWQSHSYPKDGFEVSTPGPLVMTSDSNATYYALDRTAESNLMIAKITRSRYDRRPDLQILRESCQGGADAVGSPITNQRSLELNGYPGMACSLSTAWSNMSVRYYVTPGFIYGVISTSNKEEPVWLEEEKFFDSFRLTI